MRKFHKLLFALALCGVAFTSCSKDDETSGETAGFRVSLVDAPGDYEKVLIDVQGIEIKTNGDSTEFGVVEPGVYDLLELTGGVSALLVDTQIPEGTLSQIRLILGENNSVVVDGEQFDLNTPSAMQSGLKLNVHEELQGGILYEFILDFNVDKSIVVSGDGQAYNLKPVIRASSEAISGSVSGVVTPAEVQSLVTATDGINEISAYSNTETGEFSLFGVPAGTYTVTIEPDTSTTLAPFVVKDVIVENGETKDLGTITLE